MARRRRTRPAARRGPAGQLAGLRQPGVPARPAGVGHPVPHRDDAGVAAQLGRRGRGAHGRLRHRGDPRSGGEGRRRRGRGLAATGATVRRDRPRSGCVRAPRTLRISTADPITDPAEIRAALAAELQASRGQLLLCRARFPGRPRRTAVRHDRRADQPRAADRRGVHVLSRVGFHDGAQAEKLLSGPTLRWWDADAGPADRFRRGQRDRGAGPKRRARHRAGRARPAGRRRRGRRGRRRADRRDPHQPAAGPAAAEPARNLDGARRSPRRQPARLAGAARRRRRPGRAGAGGPDRGQRRRRRARPRHRDGRRAGAAHRVQATTALRVAYLRELTAIAGRDLGGDLDFEAVTQALAHLADQTLQAGLAVAAAGLPAGAAPCRLAIIAMGKSGGRELNYVSDVDVIFVAEATRRRRRAGARDRDHAGLARRCSICRVGGLGGRRRPAPRGSRRAARAHAGQPRGVLPALGQHLGVPGAAQGATGRRRSRARARATSTSIAPLVWTAAERPDFVADVQAMRRRAIANLPSDVAPPRDQARPGRPARRRVRDPAAAARARARRRIAAAARRRCRRWPRCTPAATSAATTRSAWPTRTGSCAAPSTGCSCAGCGAPTWCPTTPTSWPCWRAAWAFARTPAAARPRCFEAEWALHAREVRRLHEKLFYRPLLEAVARVPSEALRLTPGRGRPAAGRARLRRSGRGAAPHRGADRRVCRGGPRCSAPCCRSCSSYFADAPDPDAGLLAYRQVSDALGETPWYLRLLRDEGEVAARLAYVLATSRYVADMLPRAPEALQMLAGDDRTGAADRRASCGRRWSRRSRANPTRRGAVAVVRGLRRHELLRIAFADLLGPPRRDRASARRSARRPTRPSMPRCRRRLTRSRRTRAGADCRSGSRSSRWAASAAWRPATAPTPTCCSSTRRSTPTHPGPDDLGLAQRIVARLRAMLAAPSTDPPLGVDADLRPEGRNGPLVRSLASYAHYYARWSSPWEAQALLRARFVVGDAELGRAVHRDDRPGALPGGGLSAGQLLEIRRIKGRVDSERLPRGADPATHTKLGRGGLADIEWTVQLLQLRHGADCPGCGPPRRCAASDAARDAGPARRRRRRRAARRPGGWRPGPATRSCWCGTRPIDQLPDSGPALVGGRPGDGLPGRLRSGQLIDDYRRVTRHARIRAKPAPEDAFSGSA